MIDKNKILELLDIGLYGKSIMRGGVIMKTKLAIATLRQKFQKNRKRQFANRDEALRYALELERKQNCQQSLIAK